MAQTKSSRKARKTAKTYSKPRVLILGMSAQRQVRDAGGEPVCVPARGEKAKSAAAHENIHAVLLLGGSDIDPQIYGASRHPKTQASDETRDLAELYALEEALARGIPVLGICRGSQLINAACGGTLHQHLGDLKVNDAEHRAGKHAVRAAKGSRLRKAFEGEERAVRSLHHQAVDKVAPGFVATGWSRDGVVESIESVEGWVVGVQFHPEMLSTPPMQRIFNGLVAAAAKQAGMPVPKTAPLPAPPRQRPKVEAARRDWRRALDDAIAEEDEERVDWVINEQEDDLLHAMLDDTREQRKRPRKQKGTKTYWRCFACRIDFDERDDHADHMLGFHGVEVRKRVRNAR